MRYGCFRNFSRGISREFEAVMILVLFTES